MKKSALLILIIFVLACGIALAQTAAFTYQGKLTDGGTSPTAQYDFTFKLFSAASGGTQIGADASVGDVPVAAGVFTVNLNFTQSPFTSTTGNYLEISVRPGAATGAYTTLSPRQPITSSPYSVQTIRAATADNALNLGGLAANQFVQTGDTRLSDDRAPLPNSPNYLQNNPAAQQAASFNVNGSGTVGGTLTGSVVNAATQFNIGGNRILSLAGTNNFFAGVGAGQSNSTGQSNAFFGAGTGQTNTAGNFNAFFGSGAGLANNGSENSFFGYTAGRFNTTGSINSFFGTTAGLSNTVGDANSFFGYGTGFLNTLGNNNTFFGVLAGDANTTGSKNTVIGSTADVSTNNLNYATAIGADSVVSSSNTVVLGRNLDTVRIPGNLNVAGSFTGSFTVPASSVTGVLAAANGGTGLSSSGAAGNFLRSGSGGVWTTGALQSSDLPGGNANYIQNIPGTGQQTAGFNISGSGSANIFNAGVQFNIGGNRVLSVGGAYNIFAGSNAGTSNTTGNTNSFFGADAGAFNTEGTSNSFVGAFAGANNSTGFANSFVGVSAGVINSTGFANSFVGGRQTGRSNTTGSKNSFFGTDAGASNMTGSDNTIIGTNADVGSSNLSNATALGANAVVSQSNSLVLGSGVNVGVGTTAPIYKLHVVGENVRVEGNNPSILPRFSHNFTGGAPNEKKWQNYATANALNFTALNDAESAETSWLQVVRGTETTISSVVFHNGNVVINQLGAAGSTSLCRNALNQISTCTPGNSPEQSRNENAATLDALSEQIKRQQRQIDELKQIVCAVKPDAAVCRETNK